MELDHRIAAVVLSNEESSEYAKLYHPYAYEDFKKFAPALPLDDFFQAVLGQTPDKVIVDEERFWQATDQFYSEEAWPLQRQPGFWLWSIFQPAISQTRFVSYQVPMDVPFQVFQKLRTKVRQPILGPRSFKQALGLWYAHEKFSPEAKADVEKKSGDYD